MSAFDCNTLDERLIDFLYGELEPSEMQAAEAHVAGCARCAEQVASFRRVRQAASALTVEEPPADSMALLLAEAAAAVVEAPRLRLVASSPAPVSTEQGAKAAVEAKARRAWWTRPAWAAAASFVVVGLGTAWLLRVNPVAVQSGEPTIVAQAPSVAAGAPVAAPSQADGESAAAPAPPAEAAPAMPAAPSTVSRDEPRVAAMERERAEAEPVAKKKMHMAEKALPSKGFAGAVDRLDAPMERGGGMPVGLGSGGASIGRAASPAPRSASAPAREPSGHGAWLHADENRQLARSTLPSSPLAGASSDGASFRAKSAAPLKDEPPVAIAEDATSERLTSFREALASDRCVEAVSAYRAIRATAPGTLSAADREGAAGCLVRLDRLAEAERELRALAADTPALRDEVNRRLSEIAARRQTPPQAAPASESQ